MISTQAKLYLAGFIASFTIIGSVVTIAQTPAWGRILNVVDIPSRSEVVTLVQFRDLQIDGANGKLEAAQDRKAFWDNKEKETADQDIKNNAVSNAAKQQNIIDALDRQLKSLEKARDKN